MKSFRLKKSTKYVIPEKYDTTLKKGSLFSFDKETDIYKRDADGLTIKGSLIVGIEEEMFEESIFQKGDTVYDYRYGWGTVESLVSIEGLEEVEITVVVKFGFYQKFYTYEGAHKNNFATLSFTEYNLSETLSQDRKDVKSIGEVEAGELIYVTLGEDPIWYMGYATGKTSKDGIEFYRDQLKSGETLFSKCYSRHNPLINN